LIPINEELEDGDGNNSAFKYFHLRLCCSCCCCMLLLLLLLLQQQQQQAASLWWACGD
jgi:hypothetical protein